MNIEIRKLTRDDWKIFKELRLQMVKEEPQAFLRTYEELVNLSDDEWMDKSTSDTSGILAVWYGGKLAGMNGYYFPNVSTAEIWGMFIRKEFRGKGLSKILMKEIEDEIRKNKKINLIRIEVTTSQIPAWELYKKMGFIEVGRKNGATKFDGTLYDDIILEKEVPQP